MGCIGLGACFSGGSTRGDGGGSDDEGRSQRGRYIMPTAHSRETQSDDEIESGRRSGNFNTFSDVESPPSDFDEAPRTSQRWNSIEHLNNDDDLAREMGNLEINSAGSSSYSLPSESPDLIMWQLQADGIKEKKRRLAEEKAIRRAKRAQSRHHQSRHQSRQHQSRHVGQSSTHHHYSSSLLSDSNEFNNRLNRDEIGESQAIVTNARHQERLEQEAARQAMREREERADIYVDQLSPIQRIRTRRHKGPAYVDTDLREMRSSKPPRPPRQ